MECSKEFSITVVTPSVLFVNWTTDNLAEVDGTAVFSPADGASGNTSMHTVATSAPLGLVEVQRTGFLTWNSTSILPCNMHINVSSVGTPPDPNLTWVLTVSNGGLLVGESNLSLGLNGSFDVPFDLPNTGGVDVLVSWLMVTHIDSPTNLGSLVVEGIFTVV